MTDKELFDKIEQAYNLLDEIMNAKENLEEEDELGSWKGKIPDKSIFGSPGWAEKPNSALLLPTANSKQWEGRYMTTVFLPTLNRKLYVHKLISDPLLRALHKTASLRYDINSIGCFNPRKIGYNANGNWSYHAFGAAVDINPETNRRGTRGDIPIKVIRAFEEEGFYWGGRWLGQSQDPMHFQYHGV